MTTRNHANLREGGTELERVAQNKLHEMLMIEYGFVTENVEPMKALLTTYAQTVAEEAVRAERERVRIELGQKLTCSLYYQGSPIINKKDVEKALTPLPDKE